MDSASPTSFTPSGETGTATSPLGRERTEAFPKSAQEWNDEVDTLLRDYRRSAADSLDKWILAISCAAIGFLITHMRGEIGSATWLRFAVCGFILAILLALSAKAWAYWKAGSSRRRRLEYRRKGPEVVVAQMPLEYCRLTRMGRVGNSLSALCFMAFVASLSGFCYGAVLLAFDLASPPTITRAMPDSLKTLPVGVAWEAASDPRQEHAGIWLRVNTGDTTIIGVTLYTDGGIPVYPEYTGTPDSPESQAVWAALREKYKKAWSRTWHVDSGPGSNLIGKHVQGERLWLHIWQGSLWTKSVGGDGVAESEVKNTIFRPVGADDSARMVRQAIKLIEVRTATGSTVFYADEIGTFTGE